MSVLTLATVFKDIQKRKMDSKNTQFDKSLKDFILDVHPILYGNPFLWKDFHTDLADLYSKIANREIEKRLVIVNMPPRFSKTLFITYYIAWCFLHNPRAMFIYVSYSSELSNKMSEDIKRVLSLHSQKVALDKDAVQRWNTKEGGGLWVTTTQGAVTGFGAGDLYGSKFSGELILDDPQNPKSSFYQTQREIVHRSFVDTLWSRRNNKELIPTIVNQQRLHEDDLSGHLIYKFPNHIRLCIKAMDESGKAVFPESGTSERVLLELKEASPYTFWAQQMQEPRAYSGGFFNTEKLGIISEVDFRNKEWLMKFYVRAWDFAGIRAGKQTTERHDYTRGVLFCTDGDCVYIVDLKTHHGTVEQNDVLLVQTAQSDGWRTHITIPEDAGVAGQHYCDYLQHLPELQGFSLNPIRPTKNKQLRAAPFAAFLNHGKVIMVSDENDNQKWNLALQEELASFPNGYHDDIIDACSDAFFVLHQVKKYV